MPSSVSSWLDFIHPYPAMLPSTLAADLAARFAKKGEWILDPFCGTGRTLVAASSYGAAGIGVDINPLAQLVVAAKHCRCPRREVTRLLADIGRRPRQSTITDVDLEPGREVSWFSPRARQELPEIIAWINNRSIPNELLYLVAAVLSATVRESSFGRKRQWKLHRLSPDQRSSFLVSPWQVFDRRMQRLVAEYEPERLKNSAQFRCVIGDATQLEQTLRDAGIHRSFDAVLTSPPYGDSRTTVQYGGMSSLCLGVIRHIHNLKIDWKSTGVIDAACLGGRAYRDSGPEPLENLRRYWRGGSSNFQRPRVLSFLADFSKALIGCCRILNPRSYIVLVLSRRLVGGRRLKLDLFATDLLCRNGFNIVEQHRRVIESKNTPFVVNRFGRANPARPKGSSHVRTMREEIVLVLERGGRVYTADRTRISAAIV